MTEPTTDELLSRVLDGEATSHERAQVQADPDLVARLDRLRAARALLATPPAPLPATTVDALVETAMAAGPTAPAPEVAPVVALRPPWHRRPVVVGAISAAAAILALAVVVPLLGRDESADQQASVASEAADEATGTGDAPPVGDLGDLDELDEVAAALAPADGGGTGGDALGGVATDEAEELDDADQAAGAPTTTVVPDAEPPAPAGRTLRPVPPGADALTWCGDQLAVADATLDGAVLDAATLRWRGEPALAYLLDGAPSNQVVVVSATSCEVLAGPDAAD